MERTLEIFVELNNKKYVVWNFLGISSDNTKHPFKHSYNTDEVFVIQLAFQRL